MNVTNFEKYRHNFRTSVQIAVDADSLADLIGNPPHVRISRIFVDAE